MSHRREPVYVEAARALQTHPFRRAVRYAALSAGEAFDRLTGRLVTELATDAHEIGSHTLAHLHLRDVGWARAEEEIAGSRELLARYVGCVRHFAWPFGTFADITPDLVKLAFDCGFESCASAVRGC